MTNKEKVLKTVKKYYEVFEYTPSNFYTFFAARCGMTRQGMRQMFLRDPAPFLAIDPSLKKLINK